MRLSTLFASLLCIGAAWLGNAYAFSDEPSRLAEYEAIALTRPGNAENGRRLFLDEQRTKCVICHKVGNRGGEVGPDLTHIGGKFDRPHLVEALLEPSRQIAETYRSHVVVTEDGRVVTGVLRRQSETGLVLMDADGKEHELRSDDIDERRESHVSLMPEGLEKQLTPEQFADVIAYLETLRSGGKATPGAAVAGAIRIPDGFVVETVATGLTGATALETLADGRVLVCEQTGALRVVKDDRLLEEPMLRLTVDSTWERGLIGVTVAPNFPQDPHLYVCYVAPHPHPHHRVSRFKLSGDRTVSGSEEILLRGDNQQELGGTVPAGHQGGAVHFGKDGMLYVGIGEQTAQTPSQEVNSLLGKILRIAPDGSIPADNPFVSQATGKYGSVWAMGMRNPFTFAFDERTGDLLVNDVGGKSEEINRVVGGVNYGWPTVDHGPTDDKRFRGPVHFYPQASISGGDFAPTASPWPEKFRGQYFFADYVHGWIHMLDPSQRENTRPAEVVEFVSGMRRPVDLRFATDGSLYVLLRNAWVIDGKFEGSTGSLLKISYVGERSVANERSPRVHVWYGERQRFGHIGRPQRWINVLGRVQPAESTVSYRLNGSDPISASVGPNFTRLANPGDFNLEIDSQALVVGDNRVSITARAPNGSTSLTRVNVHWSLGQTTPLPLHIDWSEVRAIDEVAQVVDGLWRLTENGVRVVEPYYDRVIAVGDESWTNYEIETQVTFHGRRIPGTKDGGRNVIHAALASRWPGHDDDGRQPRVKWYPLGATSEFMLTNWPDDCRWRILGGANRDRHAYQRQGRRIDLNQPYGMKHRVTSAEDGATRYSVKLWPSGSAEPATWDLVGQEGPDDVQHGGALLIAHYTDVTFGDVTVRAVE